MDDQAMILYYAQLKRSENCRMYVHRIGKRKRRRALRAARLDSPANKWYNKYVHQQ